MKFTVVLARPFDLAQANDVVHDIYVACRTIAPDKKTALKFAQLEALRADTEEWGEKAMRNFEVDAQEYELLVMFEGHLDPVWYGDGNGGETL